MAVDFTKDSAVVTLKADTSAFDVSLLRAQKNAESFARFVNKVVSNIRISTLTKDFIEAGENFNLAMNQYQTVFEVLLGSVEKSTNLMDNLKEMSNTSVFELTELAEAAQLLLTCNVEAGNVIGTMYNLGEISLGSTERMFALVEAFGKVNTSGTLMSEELVKMVDNGFNPLKVISEETGTSLEVLKGDMDSGKISVQQISSSLVTATMDGTNFCSGMKTGSSDLDTSISNLKGSFSSMTEGGVKTLSKGLSTLLAPALKDVAEGNKDAEKAIKVASSAVNGLEIAYGLLTLGIKLNTATTVTSAAVTTTALATTASGATAASTTVMASMMPILPIALGIGAAIGGIIGLFSIWNDSMKDTELYKLNEELDASIEKMEQNSEATQKKVDVGAGEISYYQNLKKELDTIVDANGQITVGNETRAKFITGELGTLLGTEIKVNDDVIESYGEVGASLDDMLEKKRAATLLSAHEEDYSKALSEQQKYNENYGRLKLEVDEYDRKSAELSDDYKNGKFKNDEEYFSKLNELNHTEIAGKREALDKTEKMMLESNGIIDKYEKASIAMQEGNSEEALRIMQDKGYNMAQLDEMNKFQVQNSIEEVRALQESANRMYEETGEDRYKTMSEGYQDELTALEDHLRGQNDTIFLGVGGYCEGWAGFLEAGKGTILGKSKDFNDIGKTLVDELSDGSVSKELDANTKVERVADGMVLTINGKKYLFNEAGKFISEGVGKGVEAGQGFAFGAIGGLASGLLGRFKKIIDTNSPSRAFARIAKSIPKGISVGIKSTENEAIGAIGSLSNNIVKTFEDMDVKDMVKDMLGHDQLIDVAFNASIDNIQFIKDMEQEMSSMRGILQNQAYVEMRMKTQAPIQNVVTYNFEQTIHNLKEKSASEIANETQNLLKRARWNN